MADYPVSIDRVRRELIKLRDEFRVPFAKDVVNMSIARLEGFPQMDAVPAVRCRDCEYWSGRKDKPGEATAIGYCDHPNHHIMPLNANWYCADGVNRNGGPT